MATTPSQDAALDFVQDDVGDGGGDAFQPSDTAPLTGTSDAVSGDITLANAICKSAHPVASFFHVIFKLAAVITYLLCDWFTSNFVLVFVILILLLAFDFWTVKNVTGRLLVGLRWWNNMKPDGSSEWVFESHQGTRDVHALDWRIFWGALFIAPVLWVLLGFIAFLRNFQWLLVVCVAVSLSGANLYGFVKCSREAQSKFKSAMAQGVARGALSALGGGGLFGGQQAGGGGGATADAPGPAFAV